MSIASISVTRSHAPFTPAPWTVDEIGLVLGADWPRDIPVGRIYLDKHNGEANAQLVEAAPDMLRVLEASMHALESYAHGNASPDLAREVAEACRQVLEKAKGARR